MRMDERFNDLSLQAMEIGRDLLIVVGGGDRHIGATSTAFWKEGQVTVETCSVPGHKEYLLSDQLAYRLAQRLDRTVTLVMGIHYDGINRQEIELICEKVALLVDNYISEHSGEARTST